MKVMVALDGSENSFSALRKALQLAKPEDSILLVHTIEDIRPARFMDVTAVMDMMEQRAKKIMKRAMQICTTSGRSDETIEQKIVRTSSTREGLMHQIEKKEVDLVCMGTRGLGDVGKVLLGSTSSYVLHNAPAGCSVLIIKQEASQ